MEISKSRYGSYDIGDDSLNKALACSADPSVLMSIAELARSVFGWFNRRATRADEYVWVAGKFISSGGMTIADIGTGVSPLPIYLARQGNRLITIDSSPEERVLGNQAELDWNGWGYFDYAQVDPNIHSINIDASQAEIEASSLDCIYSVSVIEHLHSSVRRKLWLRIREWMKPHADLLLTVDLIPNSNALWNFDQGHSVEDSASHGDCESLIEEIIQAGFHLIEKKVKRDYPDTPCTDVAYLHLTKV